MKILLLNRSLWSCHSEERATKNLRMTSSGSFPFHRRTRRLPGSPDDHFFQSVEGVDDHEVLDSKPRLQVFGEELPAPGVDRRDSYQAADEITLSWRRAFDRFHRNATKLTVSA